MTRIDFYLLQGTVGTEARFIAVCKLVNKAYSLGRRIYLLTQNPEESQNLDRLLWIYNPGTFIPHGLKLEDVPNPLSVLIGHQTPPDDRDDVLISLAEKIPSFFSRFERVAEVVGSSAEEKQLARSRYRFYRDRGYPLHTHNL